MGQLFIVTTPCQISSMETEGVCKLEASVPTGLEVGAGEECAEVLGRPPVSSRGRLAFTLCALEELKKVKVQWCVLDGVKRPFSCR